MKRALYQKLLAWKSSGSRKSLLLQGARQVGKTFLVNEFGHNEYSDYVYLNFEQDPGLKALFEGNLTPESLINNIGLYLGRKIESSDTLLFFDEIQVAPKALTALKYFYEQAPEYHIIAAGSLLGVSVGKQSNFPVGKVNFIHMYPMSFLEYLQANGEELLAEELKDKNSQSFSDLIHDKLLNHLKLYLYLGGMPEVLQSYINTKDIVLARTLQSEILKAYQRDFSKYTDSSQAVKTAELWRSIPYQLSKENKKFKYSDVRKKARASTFEQTIEWLKHAGLIHLVYNLSVPKIPLAAYADYSRFKVYLLDTGLLGAILGLTSDIILDPGRLFQEYNGAYIENFITNELVSYGWQELFYWTSKSDAEVDFILQVDNKIYPMEVKSGSSRNLKSLRSYEEKYQPEMLFRMSPRKFIQSDKFVNIPLYANMHWLMKTLKG